MKQENTKQFAVREKSYQTSKGFEKLAAQVDSIPIDHQHGLQSGTATKMTAKQALKPVLIALVLIGVVYTLTRTDDAMIVEFCKSLGIIAGLGLLMDISKDAK